MRVYWLYQEPITLFTIASITIAYLLLHMRNRWQSNLSHMDKET